MCDRLDLDGIGSLLYIPVSTTNAHIAGLVIDPNYRGQGYARQLVNILKAEYSTLTANVLFSEVGNLQFWQYQGFAITETNLEAGYITLTWNSVPSAMIDASLLS